jgi:hypothetical protein
MLMIPINPTNSSQPTLTFSSVSTPETLEIWSKNNTSDTYNTSLANVAIGTTNTTSSKLNVNGTLNASSFIGNGSNIPNVAYATITGKPTNFQSDWTSTVINKHFLLILLYIIIKQKLIIHQMLIAISQQIHQILLKVL